MAHLWIKDIFNTAVDTSVTAKGWAKTRRDAKGFSFIELNDGSCRTNLQVIVEEATAQKLGFDLKQISPGTAIAVDGVLRASPGKGQKVELAAQKIAILGTCPSESYPIQKKNTSYKEVLIKFSSLNFRNFIKYFCSILFIYFIIS